MSKRKFPQAMAILRACADLGGQPTGVIPPHIRDSMALAKWVERRLAYPRAHVSDHINRDIDSNIKRYRARMRVHAERRT
jgi:hypothetical protein